MSTPTLEPDAIAALFAAAENGALPDGPGSAGKSSAGPTIRAVDFRRPRQFTPDAQRKLRRTIDTFCRTASGRLSSELRTATDLEVISVEQLTWSDAHELLPSTSLTAVLESQPLNTRLLLSAEQALVLSGIERMLGGAGDKTPPHRRLSDIDTMLAGQLFDLLVDQLSFLWDELLAATLSVESIVAPQQSAQLAPPSEPTMSFTIEAKLFTASMALVLLVPYRSVSAVIASLNADEKLAVGADDADALQHRISRVEMEVRGEAGAVHLPVDQVLALQPGDTVNLGIAAEAGVLLYVDGTPLARARPGRSGSMRAVQVLGPAEVRP
jgi:flagellar motor switch protein FliM